VIDLLSVALCNSAYLTVSMFISGHARTSVLRPLNQVLVEVIAAIALTKFLVDQLDNDHLLYPTRQVYPTISSFKES